VKEIYLDKRRAGNINRVCRCRAHQAGRHLQENKQVQAQSNTFQEARLVGTRSFNSSGRQVQHFSVNIALKIVLFTTE
jgi:hypothetical protein